jgi:hypothetical protein
MTLLTIAQEVSPNIGIKKKPTTAQDTGSDSTKIVLFANETGRELVRRVDWSSLTKRHTIAGTGSPDRFTLPDDFDRLVEGMSVTVAGAPVRGGLTADEWASLTPVEGTPRYFRIFGKGIEFYPYPAEDQDVSVSYQSGFWAKDGGGTAKASLSSDGDTCIVPEQLVTLGAIWRYLRHAGRDYSDHNAEYEAMLLDLARQESMERQP